MRSKHAWIDTGHDIGTFFYAAAARHDSDEKPRFPRDSYACRDLKPKQLAEAFSDWRDIPIGPGGDVRKM